MIDKFTGENENLTQWMQISESDCGIFGIEQHNE